jgi:hypothetical protein
MNSVLRLATVFAAGAAAMYYLDPQTGRRRRALVRDKSAAVGHDVKEAARTKTRRAFAHARGAAARTRAQVANEFVDDDILRDRVRSRLGHLVDAPIDVEVLDGRVVLIGNLTARGFDELISDISAVPGVQHVESRLQAGRATDDAGSSGEARH